MAYGGLSKKNTVKIKNIQSGATQELSIPLVVCAISYDPFGKYLLLLLRNNMVYLYNSSSLSKIREVPLSPEASPLENVNTVKELRVMGWSPDFNHLVCPSLDDSKVAVALNFSRNNSFKVRQAFLGHVSSISCSRFNPNLY
jgi:WD40 repeat protein